MKLQNQFTTCWTFYLSRNCI